MNYSNNPGRNRGDLLNRANTRLNNRDLLDMQIFGKGNLKDNIYIERDEFMKHSRTKNIDEDSFDDDNFNNFASTKNTNRITDLDFSNFKSSDRGMPIRGQSISHRRFNRDQEQDNDDDDNQNFIVTKEQRSRSNIEPFTVDTKFSIFSDINENSKLTHLTNSDTVCVTSINDFSLFLLKNLNNVLASPFVVNTLDLYSIFSSIYLSSQGNTEIELKNYFNFPKKTVLEEGLASLLKNQNNKTGNCILFNHNLTYNPEFYKLISNYSKLRKINPDNLNTEVNTINGTVNVITQHNMKKSITNSNLANLNILLLTLGYYKPCIIINTPTKPQIIKHEFVSKYFNRIITDFVLINNSITGYVETSDFNILEFAIDDSKYMLGFIQPKKNIKDISEKSIINNLDKFKITIFNRIMFPLLNIQTKLRFRNIFKKTELKTIFEDINCPDLFQDRTKIDDVLQNVEINIFPEFKNIKKEIEHKNNKEFLLASSFIYYIRMREKQCLTVVGIY